MTFVLRFSGFFFLGYAWIVNSERNVNSRAGSSSSAFPFFWRSHFSFMRILIEILRNKKEKEMGANKRKTIWWNKIVTGAGIVRRRKMKYEEQKESERESEWTSEWMKEKMRERKREKCEGPVGVFSSIEMGHEFHDNTIVMTDYLCEYWLANSYVVVSFSIFV